MTRQYIKDTPSVLMIIFINEKANVICNTYGNGWICLFVIITRN